MLLVFLVMSSMGSLIQGSSELPGLTMPIDEYYETHGLGYAVAAECLELIKAIEICLAKPGESIPDEFSLVFDDIVHSPRDLALIKAAACNEDQLLTKRKIIDFTGNGKWNTIILYLINTTAYNISQKLTIRGAMDIWENETCLRFQELPTGNTGPYIHITPGSGCSSCIGRAVDSGSQPIFLKKSCVKTGIVIHELGHAIGLVHEQARTDWNFSVTINESLINSTKRHNFVEATSLDSVILAEVPYDLSSMMHYGVTFFLNNTLTGFTLTPNDPLFFGNINTFGHFPGMTFFDAKAVNLAYCTARCPPTTLVCAHSGYEDPNKCGNCRCLEGYTGRTCTDIDPGNSGHLAGCPRAGDIVISPGSGTQCIEVDLTRTDPGYMECNWHIHLRSGDSGTIDFWFTSMSLSMVVPPDKTCFDYVEIKYKDLEIRGPRFCGSTPPPQLNSPTNFFTNDPSTNGKIMVNFASLIFSNPRFKFCFRRTPGCRIRENGIVVSSAVENHPLPTNTKTIVAERGADNDPCKTRVVARTDGQGKLIWAAVNFGLHPKYPQKFFRNYAFNLHDNPGAWERGWKLKNDPIKMTFPYPGWVDGSVIVTVEQTTISSWRVEAMCLGQKLLDFLFLDFGSEAGRLAFMSFGIYDDWTGDCF